jgi:hypothetical protein
MNITSAPPDTESNLWPAVLLFSAVYLGVSAVVTAILVGLDIDANSGVATGVLIGSAAAGAQKFVAAYHYPFKPDEQLRFALLTFLAVLVITCIQIVVVALFLVKADERQAFMTEAQAWIADNTGLLVGIMVVVALIYFAILYFTSGWFSRWFAKRLNASVRP